MFITHKTIMDDEHLHYQFARVGYHEDRHIFMAVFHIDIIKDEIWIQEDRTERGVAYRLMEKGIPQSAIVLGYYEPSFRKEVEGAMGSKYSPYM